MGEVSFDMNKIFIIESLKDDEIKTGKNLFDNQLKDRQDKLPSEFFQVMNRNDFFSCLDSIKNDANINQTLPFIHFEIHGCIEGIVTSSEEFITWREFANKLREINIITKNNLCISLATCYGAYIYSEINPTKKAPFWGFIGPWEEVSAGSISASFNSFFECLLITFDFYKSINALNSHNGSDYEYTFKYSEEVFEKVWDKYELVNYSEQGMKNRLDYLESELNKAFKDAGIQSDLNVREVCSNMLINDREEYRNKYKDNFLNF